MVSELSDDAKPSLRFAQAPWSEDSELWRQLDAQLPSDHLARELQSAMTDLDLTPLYATYAGRGKAPYRPELMLTIVLFELRRGRRQPHQWYQDTHENYVLWWLGFGIKPSRSCWYEFRDRTGSCLDSLNAQVLHQAVEGGMSRVERGALDGSTIAANASRRRLISAERLSQRIEQLESARQDDAQGQPSAEVPAWMAKTPQSRVLQHERYRRAQDHLDVLQVENQRRSPSERRTPDKIVVSLSDPDTAMGVDKDHVFRPLYTVQTLRDVDSPLVLSYEVFAQATDAATLGPMLDRTEQMTSRRLQELLVDSGYVTGVDLAICAAEDMRVYGPWKENDVSTSKPSALFTKKAFQWLSELETYQCPAGHLLKRVGRETYSRSGGREEVVLRYGVKGSTCQACPLKPQCTTSQKVGRSIRRSEHEDLIVAHQAWMETEEAKAVYRLRGQTIEIVFADLKEHRGLRRFSSRGLARVRTEVASEVLLHNLLAWHRFAGQKQNTKANHAKSEKIAA
jgi:transposase